jgi:hypothetical protein
VLFKPFSLAAVKRDRIGNDHLGKFDSQSIPMITLGRCPHSDGLQFYNPVNHTFVSSIDYRLQSNVTSGTRFGYKYQPGTFFYRLDETNAIFSPKFQLESNVLVHMHSPPHHAKVIGIPSYDHPDIYTVAFADGSIAEYSDTSGILEAIPDISVITPPSILPDWIQGGATATLFLPNMSKPRHGRLHVDSDNNWSFSPGTSTDITKHIPLPDLLANGRTLLENAQLFRGHTKFRRVYQARNQLNLRTCILRHVSAHGLTSLVAPTSLKQHEKMSSTDREIWNAAYDEEFDGLNSLPTWEIISESQYKQLCKGMKALPTMALATIKYDEQNCPKRAKYRLLVLGNLDPHHWTRESTAAPVMSQMEL